MAKREYFITAIFIPVIVCFFGIVLPLQRAYSQWKPTTLGSGSPVYALAAGYGEIFAGVQGENDDGGVFLSRDSAATWSEVYTGSDMEVNALLVVGDTILAGVNNFSEYNNYSEYKGVYRSSDNGMTWTNEDPVSSDDNVFSLASIGDSVFAGTEGGVSFSPDAGVDWIPQDSLFPVNTYVYALAVKGTQIFAGIFNSTDSNYGVWTTADYGASWSLANNGLPQSSVQALAVIDTVIYAGFDNAGVYRSTDNGAHWTQANEGLTGIYVYALCASGKNLFAGTTGGVFLSTNGGESWSDISDGLVDLTVYSLAVVGDYLVAGTQTQGIWRRPLAEIISAVYERQNVLSTRAVLTPAFPNPFSSATTISYNIPTDEKVSLIIYNAFGERCATLVNEIEEPGGTVLCFQVQVCQAALIVIV